MNNPSLSVYAATVALTACFTGCAVEPVRTVYVPAPQPSGTVSVRYETPTTAAAPPPASGGAHQLHMRRALAYLQSARAQLQSAEANKGGNRVEAIQDVDEAIGHVQAGIAVAR